MNIGKKIEYQRRKTPDMPQEELAGIIGIRAQTYRNKITGKSSFKIEEVVAIAGALNVTVEQLLKNGNDSPPPPINSEWIVPSLVKYLVTDLQKQVDGVVYFST